MRSILLAKYFLAQRLKRASKLLFIAQLLFLNQSCESKKTSRELMDERNASARPRTAAYGADAFYLDNRNPPDRENRKWDFFYKHCKLVGRDNAAPNRAEWDCTGPN